MVKVILFLACLASVAVLSCFAPSGDPPPPEPSTTVSKVSKVSSRMQGAFAAGSGRHYYVSPTGRPDGTGSFKRPWDLQTAFNLGNALIFAGDTVLLRGGTYAGTYEGRLEGTASKPVIVRAYPGEHVVIDGGDSNGQPVLIAKGSYTWYWGLEIMSSEPTRYTSEEGSSPVNIRRGEGVLVDQQSPHPGLKFINMVIHDTRQGISFWKEASDSEAYGNLIYYNGWDAPDRGHGHGIYAQNQTGVKTIADNILFSGFSHGIHVYGSASAFLDNLVIEGNTTFNAGTLSPSGGRNLLLGGNGVAQNPIVSDNSMYRANVASDDFNLGYAGGCANATVTGNYIANGTNFVKCVPVSVVENTFYGPISGFSQGQFAGNAYYADRPTGLRVFVRPNAYEPGRANITVFNWDSAESVDVDLSEILTVGDVYEVRNAQDFFGAPVLAGEYAGGSLTLPLKGLSIAAPVGLPAPAPSGPEFNAFIVLTIPSPDRLQLPARVRPTPGVVVR